MHSPRVGLRARTTAAFALGALGVSLALAAITYFLAQTYLLRQRESLALRQTYLDARVVRDVLGSGTADLGEVLDNLAGQAGSDIVVNVDGKWFSSSLSLGEPTIPSDLRDAVSSGEAGRRRVALDTVPTLVVGVPLPAVAAQYYEVFPLRELDRTLNTLLVVLFVAASITTMGGAGVGFFVSRRVLRPLREVSAVSVEIAGGALETRLDSLDDPDLTLLVESFNNMAASLQQRVEREARFASDVSHELRTPLTAMTNAMQIVRTRAGDLPERTQTALAIFFSQVEYFEQLVLDLLEISRLDAGVDRLDLQPCDVGDLVRSACTRAGVAAVVDVDAGVPSELVIDERRIGQVLANLFDNAARYAGGVTNVRIEADEHHVRVLVDDKGPGVRSEDRSGIFERFRRGATAATGRRGAGLGLAIALEHVRLHGGTIEVADAPDGGARFTVEIPMRRP